MQHTLTPNADFKINFGRLPRDNCEKPVPNPGSSDLYQRGYIYSADLGCDISLYWKPVDQDSGVSFCDSQYSYLDYFNGHYKKNAWIRNDWILEQ